MKLKQGLPKDPAVDVTQIWLQPFTALEVVLVVEGTQTPLLRDLYKLMLQIDSQF